MVVKKGRSNATSAFTLLELMIVVTIVGTLALIAVPRYARFLAEQRVDAAARRLAADLAFARRSARMASTSQTVRFNVAADSYTLVGLADPDHAATEYTVVLAKEPYGVGITAINLGGDAEIIFDGYGVPDGSGTVYLRLGASGRSVYIDGQTGQTSITRVLVGEFPPSNPLETPPVQET